MLAPDFYSDPTLLTNSTAPSDAAYLKITITIATVATQPVARTVDLTEVRLGNGLPELLFTDRNNPTNAPGYLICGNAEITLGAPTNQGFLSLGESTTMSASLEMYFDSPSVKIIGENSNWIARVSHTATQSLTNNTSTKAVLSTASSTPSIETYDPNGWFNNANDSIDIGQDGFYCVTANAAFASNATGRREVAIVVNGTTRGSVNVSAASAGTTNLSVTTNLYLVSGDQVTITLVQTSGGALNTANVAGVYPALSVGRIGA